MKKLLKYVLLSFFSIILMLIMLAQWSWFQKSCLLGILKCNFEEVNISNYQGSLRQVSAKKICCKSKTKSIDILDFKLVWNPWDLLRFKGINIQDFQGKIIVDIPANATINSEICTASFLGAGKKANKDSFLSYLQPPFRLCIENLNIWMRGNIHHTKIETANLSIQHLQQNQAGICQYSSVIKLSSNQYSSIQANGSFDLKYDKNCKIENLKCNGRIKFFGNKRYPIISYKGFIDNTTSNTGETLKFEARCGQSSDFTLTGESFKTTDHIFALKWQTILDNSFLKLFNIETLPTLSILAEGTGLLNRKARTWDTHSYFSVWGKNFESLDPTLKSLPYLSLKAQVDAEISEKFFRLKQYKAILKEKGVSHVFFDINSLQSITYDYKKGLKAEDASNLQILEVNLHEIPFAIFNPYLQSYGYKILGNLKSGNLSISWNEKTKHWELDLLQPVNFYVQQLSKDKNSFITDTNCRLNGKFAFNPKAVQANYNFDVLLTDTKHIPFFKASQQGNWVEKGNVNAHKGSLFFNHALAQNLVQLQTFGLSLNPHLIANVAYDIFSDKNEVKVNQFNINIKSDEDKAIALQIHCNNPICYKNGDLKISNEGQLAHIFINHYPLDFISHKDISLSGIISYDSLILNEKNQIKWHNNSDLHIENLLLGYRNENFLKLKQINLNAQGFWEHKKQWSLNIEKLNAISEEGKSPLLSGNAKVIQEKKNLITEGKIDLEVTQLSAQPFAIKYPGLVGDVTSQWHTEDNKQTANFHANITPLHCPLTVDLKSFYSSEENQINSILELRSAEHATDMHLNCAVQKDNVWKLKLNSEHIFVDDLLGIKSWVDSISLDLKASDSHTQQEKAPLVSSNTKATTINTSCKYCTPIHLDFDLKSICAQTQFAKDLKGKLTFTPNKEVNLKNFSGKIFNGDISMEGTYDTSTMKCTFDSKVEHIAIDPLVKVLQYYQMPFVKHAKLTGFLEGTFKGSLAFKNLLDSRFNISSKIHDGTLKLFDSAITFGSIIGGFASSLGLLAGSDANGRSAVNFINLYLRDIPFESIEGSLERNNDDKINTKINLKNEDLALYTRTNIDTKGDDWSQYPLSCELQLYAPQSSQVLNYFNFEKNLGEHQEYLKGPTCLIDGTLGKPNYSNLLKLVLQKDSKSNENSLRPVKNLLKSILN